MLGVAERRADADFVDAVDQDDVAGFRLFDRLALQAFELEDLIDLVLDVLERSKISCAGGSAPPDPSDADLADVARVVERADLELERRVRVLVAHRDVLEDRLEEGLHVRADLAQGARRPALQADA